MSSRHITASHLLIAFASAAALACADSRSRDSSDGDAATASSANTAVGVVDSTLPIPDLLARFRATVPDTPRVLAGGADSPERLARALLTAVTAHDTSAVRALIVSKAEFAWLYYPETKFTHPPYELAPDLVWLTMVAASDKGAGRLLARYGGRPLRFERLTCGDSAQVEGANTVLRSCRVRFAVPDSAPRDLRIFGAMIGRDGRYKFLSFANDL